MVFFFSFLFIQSFLIIVEVLFFFFQILCILLPSILAFLRKIIECFLTLSPLIKTGEKNPLFLFYTLNIMIRFLCSNTSIARCCYHLTQAFFSYITRGKNTINRCFHLFIGNNVSFFIGNTE